jgi:hypothetical protein
MSHDDGQLPQSDGTPHIDRLDFDSNRGTVRSGSSRDAGRSLLDEDVDFMEEIAEGILERDRQRMRREVVRILSFVCAVLSWQVLNLTSLWMSSC